MNLTTFRLRIQRTVGLAGGTAGDEQTLIDGWVNEAVEQFLIETKAVKKTASLTLAAGQGDYTIDADILAFEDLYIDPADGTQEYMMVPVDTWDIRRARRVTSSPGVPPYHYAYESQMLMIYPTPVSSSDTVHIVYVAKPSALLASGSDSPSDATRGNIPSQYHPVLEAYAMWKAAEYSNDAPSGMGEKFRAAYERGILRVKILESRKAGVRVSRARVGWRRSIPARPGIDLGD